MKDYSDELLVWRLKEEIPDGKRKIINDMPGLREQRYECIATRKVCGILSPAYRYKER
jgi:hypothetical protein